MTDIPTITQEEAVEVRAKIGTIDQYGEDAVDRLKDEVENGTMSPWIRHDLRAILSALSPNMDHAVGGVRRETLIRAMYEAWPHTVTSQALNELTGLPYGATIPYGMAQRCGASFVALERYADGILALSATTPPVNQDAVREALPAKIGRLTLGEHLSEEHYCGGDHDMPDGQPIYWQERGGEYPDDIDGYCLSCAIQQAESDSGWCECSINAALATPPLDNTGLDAATVEPVRSTVLEAAEALTREDWQIATTCGDMIDRLPCARCGAKSIKLCRSGLSIDKIDAARDFVNGYGWAAARKRALASGDRS